MGKITITIIIFAFAFRFLTGIGSWSRLSHREKTGRAFDYLFGDPFNPRPHFEKTPRRFPIGKLLLGAMLFKWWNNRKK